MLSVPAYLCWKTDQRVLASRSVTRFSSIGFGFAKIHSMWAYQKPLWMQ